MARDRRGTRGVVITEDRRTERFLRRLLVRMGFDARQLRFLTAPSGAGSGEAWVRAQYPREVRSLRSRNYQSLWLVAVVDGDNVGVTGRKREFDEALRTAGLEVRQADETIATPVPAWSIESWLLHLLGHPGVDESPCPPEDAATPWKRVFEREHAHDEGRAIERAASSWVAGPGAAPEPPSLADGRSEIARIG